MYSQFLTMKGMIDRSSIISLRRRWVILLWFTMNCCNWIKLWLNGSNKRETKTHLLPPTGCSSRSLQTNKTIHNIISSPGMRRTASPSSNLARHVWLIVSNSLCAPDEFTSFHFPGQGDARPRHQRPARHCWSLEGAPFKPAPPTPVQSNTLHGHANTGSWPEPCVVDVSGGNLLSVRLGPLTPCSRQFLPRSYYFKKIAKNLKWFWYQSHS